MLRYKCERCGREFENPDTVTEPHGEKVGCCPYCHGWFEEMHECKICGEWYTEDELTSGVCNECIYSHDTDVELCYKFGGDENALESVKINGFVASVFTPEQINEILMNEIRVIREFTNLCCLEFIGSDKSWFAEKLKEDF